MIKITKNRSYKYVFEFIYCTIVSIIFLLICTKSSPLYPFNDWVDSNAFFTMGKSMMNGKILYRDIFEQKGPLLYLIHGFAYLISNTTFIGVFIFEVISFALFLFYCQKTINIFINTKYSMISIPFIAYLVLNMYSFSHGDSAEEFCLPLLSISLYYLIYYFIFTYPKIIDKKVLLLNGVIAGLVLWIKYSLLGFWFGWMASIFFCLIISKNYLDAVKSCFVFLLGMLISTLPWIVYFGINFAIIDLLDAYFLTNIKLYSQNMNIILRIQNSIIQSFKYTIYNIWFGMFYCFGFIVFIFCNKFIINIIHRICLLSCWFFLVLGVFGGGRSYIYYLLIFSPFVVFGVIASIDLLTILCSRCSKKIYIDDSRMLILTLIFFACLLNSTLIINHNTYMLKIKKKDLVQYKFASIISETQDATLLNYGYLDLGFYTTTGITPNIKFFMKQNIDYSKFPLNMDEQNNYIKNKKIDYVVLCRLASKKSTIVDIPILIKNYELIATDFQVFENTEYEYMLFRQK